MNFEGELRKEASLLEQEAPPLLAGEFPSHAFPPVLVRYAQTLSETFRIPPAMFLVTMLGAVSAAAGKGWRLVEAAPGMSNYANIYVVMALESGSFKSIAGRIMKPIAEEESRRIMEWEQQQAPVLRAHLEGAKADVKRAAKRPADASLEADARREAECERKLLRNPRLLLGSCTTAALAQNLAHMDHETGALYSPEGGDLLRVALGLFRDRGMDADLLLSGYTGEYFSQNRVSSGSPGSTSPCCRSLRWCSPLCCGRLWQTRKRASAGFSPVCCACP